jgi:lipopolysaccharide biosynthesis glycosyltransferase
MSVQREVYATIWCGSAATAYFSGFQVLLHSIRQHDEHRPIVVLMDSATNCTPTADGPLLDDIAERHAPLIFKHVNVPVRNKHCLRSMRGSRVNGSQVASRPGLKYMFLKFALLNMTQFDRIVYVDSDAMILRPLHKLWSIPLAPKFSLAATMAIKAKIGKAEKKCLPNGRLRGVSKFNAGVMVIIPNASEYSRALHQLGHHDALMFCNDGDQTPFNFLFRRSTHCLPHTFNCYDPYFIAQPATMWNRSADRVNMSGCVEHASSLPHVVHFAMTSKPWSNQSISRGLVHTAALYQRWASIAKRWHHVGASAR